MSPDFSKNFATQATVDSVKKKGSASSNAATNTSPSAAAAKKKEDLRFFLSVILFALSFVATAAAFGVNFYFDREIDAIEKNIVDLDNAFKLNDIEGFVLFDRQVQTLRGLSFLRGGYSLLLDEASQLVVPGVYYTSASISFADANGGEGYTAKIQGSAESLETYYQQLRSFETAEGLLENMVKSDSYSLQRSDAGVTSVSFSVSFEISSADVFALLGTSP